MYSCLGLVYLFLLFICFLIIHQVHFELSTFTIQENTKALNSQEYSLSLLDLHYIFRPPLTVFLDATDKYCLKHEQQCFIGFKNTRRSRVFVNPIKHVLRVFWTASKIRDNTYLRIFLLFQKPEKTRACEFLYCFKNARKHVHANSCAASKTRENACISIDKNSVVFVESFLSRSFLPQSSLFP